MSGSVILGYHRVLASPQLDPIGRGLQVAAGRFRQHLEVLSRRFSVVPLEDLVAGLMTGVRTDGLAAVTLDDGYADNYLHAFPILSQMGIPATIFLATDCVEHQRPFWTERLWYLCQTVGPASPLPAELGGRITPTSARSRQQIYRTALAKLKALDDGRRREQWLDSLGAEAPPDSHPLTWEEIRTMRRQGIAFGAHTKTHPSLVALPDTALREEIEASRDLITARVGTEPTVFAYPFGDVDERVARAVGAAGFRGAVTVRPGMCDADSPRLLLPRFEVTDCTAEEFALRLGRLERGAPPVPRSPAARLKAAIPRPVKSIIKSIWPRRAAT